MSETPSFLDDSLSLDALWRQEAVCRRYEAAWRARRRPHLEDFLEGPEGAERAALLWELLRPLFPYTRAVCYGFRGSVIAGFRAEVRPW
jgi:hypothetical protein